MSSRYSSAILRIGGGIKSQGEIIQKPKMQELSSLFMTHRLSVMYALVKFHEYIPYGL